MSTIDPFTWGVGFAVIECQEDLIDWGIRTTGQADNRRSARVFGKLIDRFSPMFSTSNIGSLADRAAANGWKRS